ncbi:hypothetical protein WKT22_02164 [Candidatus Lokiarchaeum ossiferum]
MIGLIVLSSIVLLGVVIIWKKSKTVEDNLVKTENQAVTNFCDNND